MSSVLIWDALDVFESVAQFKKQFGRCQCAILDPWYNKGVGGVRADYDGFMERLLHEVAEFSDHIYLWGFPEILARYVRSIPRTHELTSWLTWFYKNNPSVIRGWRSAQNACLHLSTSTASLYPEHFLNEKQLALKAEGKLRYMPGPTSVIEAPLNVGFVNKLEQTGHPAQKPMSVYDQLVRMATKPGDLVFDPMCGSGTTGTVCRVLKRNAVLCDANPEYIALTKERLDGSTHDALFVKFLEKRAHAGQS